MNSNITFQQIEAFLTIARYQSITKACEVMYISQPALSKILKRFEDNIGAPLFDRTNHGAFLTPAGRMLYSSLEPLYNSLDSTLSSVRNLVGPEDRIIHIVLPAMFDICEDYEPIRALIRKFKSQYPEVRVMKSILELNRLQNMLDVGFANLIIAPEYSLNLSGNKNVNYIRMNELRQFITLSSSHPLADIREDELEQLSGERFLAVPYQDSLFSKDLMAATCRQNGLHPRVIECPPNVPTLLHGIEMEKYVSILWKTTAEGGRLKYIPLTRTDPPLHAVVAWTPDRLSRAASLFLDLI